MGLPLWKNVNFSTFGTSCFYSLERRFPFYNIIKDIFLAYIAKTAPPFFFYSLVELIDSLIVDRLVTLIVVLRTLNMWELYIAVDCWIALNRVVASKDTVLLICLNQRSGVKRIPQQYITDMYKEENNWSQFQPSSFSSSHL